MDMWLAVVQRHSFSFQWWRHGPTVTSHLQLFMLFSLSSLFSSRKQQTGLWVRASDTGHCVILVSVQWDRKAESRNILDKAIVHSRCSLTQSVWPSSESFGGSFWCPIVAFTSHNHSYHLLPPSASALASRLSRCMGGPMGKSMRLTESPVASVSLVSPRGLHPVSHFLWHESPGHVRHVHIFYNILHSLTPLSLRISKWAKLEFRFPPLRQGPPGSRNVM